MPQTIRNREAGPAAALSWLCALCLALGGAVALAQPPDQGRVARAQFTTAVVDREPVDRVLVLANDSDTVYFFTDLRHLQGHTVVHRWEFNGEVVSRVPFEVGGPRWRVYSAKSLPPDALGQWRVIVTDEQGWPLKAGVFEYVQARADARVQVILPADAGH